MHGENVLNMANILHKDDIVIESDGQKVQISVTDKSDSSSNEFSVSLGETGLGLTIGDYDDVGQYTILAYDLPISLAGLSIGLAWNDIDYDDDAAEDDDVFAITFSM